MAVSAEEMEGSLTLICKTDEEILTGLHWDIYRVGSRNGSEFVLEGEFADYPVDLTDFSADGMSKAAKTLENYAVLDGISPLNSGETNEKGLLTFYNLETGLYLVSGQILIKDNTTYVPSTLLFEIDSSGTAFDLQAYPKIIYRTISSEVSRYTVKKVWMNEDGQPADALTEITAEIYCDRELYDTVTLSSENDWTYTWVESDYHEWRVKEIAVPDGCTVAYDYNETQFAIVNTFDETTTQPTTEPTTPPPTGPSVPTEPSEPVTQPTTSDGGDTEPPADTTEPVTTVTGVEIHTTASGVVTTTTKPGTDGGKIPQTGQLWWPVPVLGFLGIIFTAAGFRMSAEEKSEHENEKD